MPRHGLRESEREHKDEWEPEPLELPLHEPTSRIQPGTRHDDPDDDDRPPPGVIIIDLV